MIFINKNVKYKDKNIFIVCVYVYTREHTDICGMLLEGQSNVIT